MNRPGKTVRREPGFTLVEIALAILVVSVGLLAVYGLFPSGFRTGRQAIDDTRAAMFAQEVFNGLKAKAAYTQFDSIDTIVLPSPTYVPGDPNATFWRVEGSGAYDLRVQDTGNDFELNKYMRRGADEDSFAMRYRLDIFPIGSTRMGAALEVWPGEEGPTNDIRVFYTEMYYDEPL